MSKLQPVNQNAYQQQSTSLALASTSQEDTAKAQSMSRAMLGGDNQRNAALPIQLRPKRTFGVATHMSRLRNIENVEILGVFLDFEGEDLFWSIRFFSPPQSSAHGGCNGGC